jgi:ribonuclease HI
MAKVDIMKKISIYTDGACSGNPGVGGWGAVLLYNDSQREISGYSPDTTNNVMEISAAVNALELLKEPCQVELYSDSAYLVNAFNQKWIENWQKNGWRTSSKEPVKNKELWEKLIKLSTMHKLKFIKVKGHSDNELNNRCDEMARAKIKEYIELTKSM